MRSPCWRRWSAARSRRRWSCLPASTAPSPTATPIEVGFVARSSGIGPSLRPVVGQALQSSLLPATAARFVADQGLGDFPAALAIAEGVQAAAPQIEVTTRPSERPCFPSTLGQFDLGASSQLILFMFITALSGGAVLIQTRQLGLSRRMLSTPTSVRTILSGRGPRPFRRRARAGPLHHDRIADHLQRQLGRPARGGRRPDPVLGGRGRSGDVDRNGVSQRRTGRRSRGDARSRVWRPWVAACCPSSCSRRPCDRSPT